MLTKILVIYSTALTTLLAAFTVAGTASARGQDRVQLLDEIDVHRINVREPDGTLRMVISNHARLPGVIVRAKENPPVDRPYAGMLFYNDEGTENGGLVFGGHRNANGEVVDAGVALSFDRYGATSQFVQPRGRPGLEEPHRRAHAVGDRAHRESPASVPRPRQGRRRQRSADGSERTKEDRAAGYA
jgi:hypothetical protein